MESSPSSSKRGKGVANNGQVAAHCLVDGCSADLSTCRDYHRRHKVCEVHSKTPKVTIAGREQRFCQQCSRFHSLVEFDEGKRSCRKRLDGHNRRRRKPQAAEGVPPRSSQTRLVSFNTTPQIAAAATSLLGFHQQQQQHCWSHNEMQQQQQQQPQQLSYAYMETPTTSLSAHFLQGISQPFVDPIGAAAAISHSDGALSLLSSPSATATTVAATAADYAALAQYHHHHQTKPDVSSSVSSTLHFPQEGSSHSHQTLSFMWE